MIKLFGGSSPISFLQANYVSDALLRWMTGCCVCMMLLSLPACQKGKDIKDFDEQAWQSDRNGCEGIRIKMMDRLKHISPELKGLSNKEIIYILGRPDKNELYRRNQKFFVYYLSPAPACDTEAAAQKEVTLSIRFNAVGLSKEVMIYD